MFFGMESCIVIARNGFCDEAICQGGGGDCFGGEAVSLYWRWNWEERFFGYGPEEHRAFAQNDRSKAEGLP